MWGLIPPSRPRHHHVGDPCGRRLPRGGGGVLGLEKGTNCGLAAAERCLSQPKMAKKKKGGGGGCPLIILYNRGAVRVFASKFPHQITIVCIQICS